MNPAVNQPATRSTNGEFKRAIAANRILQSAVSAAVDSTQSVGVKSVPSTPVNANGSLRMAARRKLQYPVSTVVDSNESTEPGPSAPVEADTFSTEIFVTRMNELMEQAAYEFKHTLLDLLRRAHEDMLARLVNSINIKKEQGTKYPDAVPEVAPITKEQVGSTNGLIKEAPKEPKKYSAVEAVREICRLANRKHLESANLRVLRSVAVYKKNIRVFPSRASPRYPSIKEEPEVQFSYVMNKD